MPEELIDLIKKQLKDAKSRTSSPVSSVTAPSKCKWAGGPTTRPPLDGMLISAAVELLKFGEQEIIAGPTQQTDYKIVPIDPMQPTAAFLMYEMPEEPPTPAQECTLLAEPSLRKIWDNVEEDEA